jgi:hypothetical protein
MGPIRACLLAGLPLARCRSKVKRIETAHACLMRLTAAQEVTR